MEVRKYTSNLLASNMYVLVEDDHAIVIDPFNDMTPIEGLQTDRILLTHEHYDHISGVNVWKEKTGAPVMCSKACAERICDPRENMARYFTVLCEVQTWIALKEIPLVDRGYSCKADEVYMNEVLLDWMGHSIQMFEMPGHSMGSSGILVDHSLFFSGDSLMKEYDIELRFPGGSRKSWQEFGIERLNRLPNGVHVYPGHFEEFDWWR